MRSVITTAAAALLSTACALRLGGPSPERYETVVMAAPPNAAAADVGARLRAAQAEIVLLSAQRDSAWFAAVASAADLALSGPGSTSGRALAFMTDLELLGDTSLALNVPGGGQIHMHDALYKIDKHRNLDLMMVRFDAPDIRAAVTTLFAYFASDVGADAAILLAVDGPTPQLADSVVTLMRAHLSSATECESRVPVSGTNLPVRLLYGPSARVTCPSVRLLDETALAARVQVER